MNLVKFYTIAPFVLISLLGMNTTRVLNEITVVRPFTLSRYTGQWFEIARMDFRFERNLSNVTANYSLKNDGTIKVVNRGYDTVKRVWKEAVGKAKFAGTPDEARLKVSFFGPFYGAYNVIALDKDYKYALIAGSSTRYLWILSRETSVPGDIKQSYLKIAADLGYDTSALIWTVHDKGMK